MKGRAIHVDNEVVRWELTEKSEYTVDSGKGEMKWERDEFHEPRRPRLISLKP